MNNIVVIHQPDFLPHLGFFHKLLNCNTFVIFDNVQFLKRGWHHRDKIKTPDGDKWLTINTQKCPQKTIIKDVIISYESDWKQQHLNLIKENYSKTNYFDEIYPHIQENICISIRYVIRIYLKFH